MQLGSRQDRISSAVAVAAIHLALGYAFVVGLNPGFVRSVSPALKLFDIAAEPPPPPVEPTPPPEPKAPGEAAPPNLKSEAAPVAAPEPVVPPPVPPVRAADTPGTGAETSQGASDRPGPGTGAGGEGQGFGGGGIAVRARQIAGRIEDDDYPRAASRARAEGEVLVRFTVSPAGRAEGCAVLRSSGHALLDDTTCRLIERRFRFRPARNAYGDPVPETRMWEQRWWLEPR